MPTTYKRKDGTIVKYTLPPDRDHGPSVSRTPNLTLNLSDPSLVADLTALAKALGHVRERGQGTGEGSMSALINALGEAARRDGVAAVAKRLKFIAKKG